MSVNRGLVLSLQFDATSSCFYLALFLHTYVAKCAPSDSVSNRRSLAQASPRDRLTVAMCCLQARRFELLLLGRSCVKVLAHGFVCIGMSLCP